MADGDTEIHTPEHFLAAATGLGLDNLTIEMDNQEMPGMDGSSLDFVSAFRDAGIVEQTPSATPTRLLNPWLSMWATALSSQCPTMWPAHYLHPR